MLQAGPFVLVAYYGVKLKIDRHRHGTHSRSHGQTLCNIVTPYCTKRDLLNALAEP